MPGREWFLKGFVHDEEDFRVRRGSALAPVPVDEERGTRDAGSFANKRTAGRYRGLKRGALWQNAAAAFCFPAGKLQ